MPGIDDLDADRALVDIGLAAPMADAGVPGALTLIHQRMDASIFLHYIMAADFAGRIAQARQCFGGGRHTGVMQHQHVNHMAVAAVGIRGRGCNNIEITPCHVASPSRMVLGRRMTITATPSMVIRPPAMTCSVSSSAKT